MGNLVISKMSGLLSDYSYIQLYWLGQASTCVVIYTLQVLRGTYNDKYASEKEPDAKLGLLQFRKRFPAYYVVGVGWLSYVLWTSTNTFCLGGTPNDRFLRLLDFVSTPKQVRTDQTCILIASVMFLSHVTRRFYESSRISIFSRKQVIGPLYLLLSYGHFVVAGLTLLADAPSWSSAEECLSLSHLNWYHLLGAGLFILGSKLQFNSFTQFAKLRRNRAGHIVTTAHKMPKGGQFDKVSSPHYLGEILIYGGIGLALGLRHTSWNMLFLYVAGSHLVLARGAHLWYRNKFPDYPKDRRMLIPYIL